jgi:hypothetical protein
MGLSSGPNSSTLGLAFAYDTGDTVNSYIGEPTTNLLYSPGATNLTNGAGDIYGRCTKTDLGNGKYRFINNGTGVSTVRVYTNQSDLINGATYGCSVYFEELVGSISIDWCDTGITGINSSTNPSGRLGGYGTRPTYDGPYYFLDINFDSGGAVTLFNPQVEYKSHVTPFVAGTRSVTQGLLPLTGSTINLADVSFTSTAQLTFDGTNDYINTDYTSGYEGTVELIIQSSGYDGSIPFSLDSDNFSSGPNIYFTGNVIAWNTGDSANNPFSNSSYPNSNYHHLVITNQSSGAALYIDGVLIGTAAGRNMTTTGSNKLWLGRFHGGGYYLNGNLPVVRLYNRPLGTSEIQENYRGYKTRFNLS